MDQLILMKLYDVIVYDLRMCIKKDNSCPKHSKGGNYLCEMGILCDFTQISFFILLIYVT